MTQIKTAVVIGSGNVASHFGKALRDAGVIISQVAARDTSTGSALAHQLDTSFERDPQSIITNADLYVLAVSDDAIADVSGQLPGVEGIVLHTSGAAPLDQISEIHKNKGVCWPLQSINSSAKIDWKQVPLCIEGSNLDTLEAIRALALRISSRVETLTSEQRALVHVSAVFVNNFANNLYQVAYQLLEKKGVAPDILFPLISATASKLSDAHPKELQTGPAKRGDEKTIAKHLALLGDEEHLKKIYNLLTDSIARNHNGS